VKIKSIFFKLQKMIIYCLVGINSGRFIKFLIKNLNLGKSKMKIAVASQNRREITDHTGRCRKFWIYEIEFKTIVNKELLELAKEQCFHDSSPNEPSPLGNVQVLIAGGMGTGLVRRLENWGIKALITTETDPDKAVEDYLQGTLVIIAAKPHAHNHKNARPNL
jgi:predicted Fe-Mo cluster-binding NifX family protein